MKKCGYCGHQNEDAAVACSGCGTRLESPPLPEADPRAIDPARALVIVGKFQTMEQASLLVTRLQAAGIEACIPEEYASQVFSNLIPLGGVTVRVAAKDFEAAKAIAGEEEDSGLSAVAEGTAEDDAGAAGGTEGAIADEKKGNKVIPYVLVIAAVVALFAMLAAGYRETEARLLLGSGNAFVHSGDWDKAIEEFNRAIPLNPHYALAYYDRAYAYERKGDQAKEMLDLNEALRLNPQDAKAYVNRGRAYRKSGEFEKALADLDNAVRLAPGRPSGWANRGYVFLKKQDFGKAINDLDEAIRLNPTDSSSYANRGYAYEQKGELDKAISDFTEVIHLAPTNVWACGSRGAAYTKKEDWDKAISDFDTVIRLDPNEAHAYYNRGHAWYGKGDYTRAVSDFHDAIRLGPTNAYGYNGLAWLLATCPAASLRDGKQAVELATRACGLSDWRSWFCVGTLGAAYAEAGDFEKAIQYQKRALAMSGLTDKQRAEAEQRLALYEQHQAYRESPSH